MEKYLGEVQNVVVVGEGEYRVTFRAYDKMSADAQLLAEHDIPYTVYSMLARRENADFRFVAEGDLGECVSIVADHVSPEQVDELDREKWEIGVLANELFNGLVDTEMFLQCLPEELD